MYWYAVTILHGAVSRVNWFGMTDLDENGVREYYARRFPFLTVGTITRGN